MKSIIEDGVIIANGLSLGYGCVIGCPPEHKEYFKKLGYKGNVVIGANVVINNLVTIDSGIETPTTIGHNSFIMSHCHIGHDAILHENVTLSPGAVIGGHAEIGKNATIGINASVHQRVKIPEGCMIGMGTIITKGAKMIPYRIYVDKGRDLGDNEVLIKKLGLSPTAIEVARDIWEQQNK